jgi:hypothetical protein
MGGTPGTGRGTETGRGRERGRGVTGGGLEVRVERGGTTAGTITTDTTARKKGMKGREEKSTEQY